MSQIPQAPPRPEGLSPFPVQQQPTEGNFERFFPYIAVGAVVAGLGYYVYTVVSGSTFGDTFGKLTAGFASELGQNIAKEIPKFTAPVIDAGLQVVDQTLEKVVDPAVRDIKNGFDLWGEVSYGRGAGTIPELKPCPSGWTNMGLTCFNSKTWQSTGRLGGDAWCGIGKENDGGLCYPRCKAGYHGVGPTCWNDKPGVPQYQGDSSPASMKAWNEKWKDSGKGIERAAFLTAAYAVAS